MNSFLREAPVVLALAVDLAACSVSTWHRELPIMDGVGEHAFDAAGSHGTAAAESALQDEGLVFPTTVRSNYLRARGAVRIREGRVSVLSLAANVA